jgi:hypothetical protein
MKNDDLDKDLKALFSMVQDVPLEEPKDGHRMRFMHKLNEQQKQPVKKLHFWKPIAIAASFLVLIGLGFPLMNQPSNKADLASISPEFAQTQQFFTSTIKRELDNLKREKAPETLVLIEDALDQMDILEKDYENLKKDLVKSGNDERVIHAMISNFQNRIDLLQNVLEQIEKLKTLKLNTHETII